MEPENPQRLSVERWLVSIGLEEYVEKFREEKLYEIDDVKQLTIDELKDAFGMKLGDISQMRKSFARMNANNNNNNNNNINMNNNNNINNNNINMNNNNDENINNNNPPNVLNNNEVVPSTSLSIPSLPIQSAITNTNNTIDTMNTPPMENVSSSPIFNTPPKIVLTNSSPRTNSSPLHSSNSPSPRTSPNLKITWEGKSTGVNKPPWLHQGNIMPMLTEGKERLISKTFEILNDPDRWISNFRTVIENGYRKLPASFLIILTHRYFIVNFHVRDTTKLGRYLVWIEFCENSPTPFTIPLKSYLCSCPLYSRLRRSSSSPLLSKMETSPEISPSLVKWRACKHVSASLLYLCSHWEKIPLRSLSKKETPEFPILFSPPLEGETDILRKFPQKNSPPGPQASTSNFFFTTKLIN
jgi:hypothetical protein